MSIQVKILPPLIKTIYRNYRSFFVEILKDEPNKVNVLLVYFATEENAWEDKFEGGKEWFSRQNTDKEFNFVLATIEDFMEQLKDADVVYLHGGNTALLLKALKKYPEFVNRVGGKTIAGSSAGAYALSKYFISNSQTKLSEGLGLVPVRLRCHYDKEADLNEIKKLESIICF